MLALFAPRPATERDVAWSRARMKRVLALIEPVAILMIGGIIGVFVTAIILAITSVNTLPL